MKKIRKFTSFKDRIFESDDNEEVQNPEEAQNSEVEISDSEEITTEKDFKKFFHINDSEESNED